MLTTACRAARDWHRPVPGRRRSAINVNVAVGQLHDPGLPDHVRSTLAGTGLPPHLLYLELTESAVLGEEAGPVDALAGLAAAGVRLVIDDFGTGYSNLAAPHPAAGVGAEDRRLVPHAGDPAATTGPTTRSSRRSSRWRTRWA